jgi:kynurenine 3-monooxygenase
MKIIPKKIAIVGSGLVGSLLGIYLKKQGHTVHIFDRSVDTRTIDFSGRSINLALSNRGWKALEKIGLADDIKKIGIPMDKRAIHIGNEPVKFQKYGNDGEAIYALSRGVLNNKMIDLAEEHGVEFFFNHKIWDVTLQTATLHEGTTEKSEWNELEYDLVFGADGAFSRIRHKMQRQSLFNYSQEFIHTGYKELNIPAGENGTHLLNKNSLHIWPRGEYMLIALPNLDGSFTCTLFMPFEGKNSFDSLYDAKTVKAFFLKNFPDTEPLIPKLTSDFFENPTSYLVTMKCFPWTYKDKVCLIGDAAHAIVPFYGQGMNAGFEDITVLSELISMYQNDWKTIFETYQNMRKPNTDAIAELSFRNFQEMSSKTADNKFLLQKKIETWFANKHPNLWKPLYSRVTFSNEPYSEALQMGEIQNQMMQKVLQLPDIENNWESETTENYLIKLISEKNF